MNWKRMAIFFLLVSVGAGLVFGEVVQSYTQDKVFVELSEETIPVTVEGRPRVVYTYSCLLENYNDYTAFVELTILYRGNPNGQITRSVVLKPYEKNKRIIVAERTRSSHRLERIKVTR